MEVSSQLCLHGAETVLEVALFNSSAGLFLLNSVEVLPNSAGLEVDEAHTLLQGRRVNRNVKTSFEARLTRYASPTLDEGEPRVLSFEVLLVTSADDVVHSTAYPAGPLREVLAPAVGLATVGVAISTGMLADRPRPYMVKPL